MNVAQILKLVHRFAPSDLAESWDNPGLQAGSLASEVQRVGLALDATNQTVTAALSSGCQLLLTHHPLIFKALKNIDFSSPTGRLIQRAASAGLSIASAHTNWDSAEGGVAAALAELLELEDWEPLEPVGRSFLKVVVFVPAGHEESLRSALFAAGAGVIGRYDRCYFQQPGQGGFRPPLDSAPFLGQMGHDSQAEEIRLEMILPAHLEAACAQAIYRAHPYEEPAFEFHKINIWGRAQGMGLLGHWRPGRNLFSILARSVGLTSVKWAGPRPDKVETVALLPGSGGSFVRQAQAAGAQVLITGDASYHQALEAGALGLSLVDLGHFESEWPCVPALAKRLKEELAREKSPLDCLILPQSPAWSYGATEA